MWNDIANLIVQARNALPWLIAQARECIQLRDWQHAAQQESIATLATYAKDIKAEYDKNAGLTRRTAEAEADARKQCEIADQCAEEGCEWDCQCARCGSTIATDDCSACEGLGIVDIDREDEVALAKALREAGRGKCLKCGAEYGDDGSDTCRLYVSLHCHDCGGVLEPVEKTL